ncbi:hypothetical protein HHE02_16470 [Helicobacter heilmannii]|nr:hypothetical protein HHE02_16470 [Helicobacter heilmannii]
MGFSLQESHKLTKSQIINLASQSLAIPFRFKSSIKVVVY